VEVVSVTPWYQDRGGFGGEYHPDRCIAVGRHGFDSVGGRDDCPDAEPLVNCLLCEAGITPDDDRLASRAREIADDLTLERFELEDRTWSSRQFDPLRTIDAVAEQRLVDEGYLDDNRGGETVRLRDWQDKRRACADKAQFEYLLRDAIEAHLVFYREYKSFSDNGTFVDEVLSVSGTRADKCAQNIAKTWQWLQEIDAPEALDNRQAELAEFRGGEPA